MRTESQLEITPSPRPDFLLDSRPEPRIARQSGQLSVAQMFVLMTLSALALVIYQFAGLFWSALILLLILVWRIPSSEGNPLVQAMGYALFGFAATMGLVFACKVTPIVAIFPCCFVPSLAYLIGFHKSFLNDA